MDDRKAFNLDKDEFNAIYDELYKLGEAEQKAYAARGKKRPHVSESQKALELFCRDMMTVGEALYYIKAKKQI